MNKRLIMAEYHLDRASYIISVSGTPVMIEYHIDLAKFHISKAKEKCNDRVCYCDNKGICNEIIKRKTYEDSQRP